MRITKWRLALAIVAVVALGSTAAYADHVFDDLPDERFYADAAEWAKDNGITVGCNGGADFCGEDPVTRGENITFAKRYHDNIVQPALADIEADVDALEAADNVTHGSIVLSHGTESFQANSGITPTSVSNFVSATRVTGDGGVQISITGPASIDGVEYGFRSIEYCVGDFFGGAFVDRVEVWEGGSEVLLGGDASDQDDKSSAGCYSFDVNLSGGYSYGVMVVVGGGAGTRLDVLGLRTTWEPVSAGGFTPLTVAGSGGSDGERSTALPD